MTTTLSLTDLKRVNELVDLRYRGYNTIEKMVHVLDKQITPPNVSLKLEADVFKIHEDGLIFSSDESQIFLKVVKIIYDETSKKLDQIENELTSLGIELEYKERYEDFFK